ncbi:MAG: hypothetical protein HYV61_11025 [Candidatus Rokubacteria bacterium]|nr:hypothetical protein [Candidatus Rokubacteria bacterium]
MEGHTPKKPWYPWEVPPGAETRSCEACGRPTQIPWILRRDRERRIWRRWICTSCHAWTERPEEE